LAGAEIGMRATFPTVLLVLTLSVAAAFLN
jgi:hypothetical protein